MNGPTPSVIVPTQEVSTFDEAGIDVQVGDRSDGARVELIVAVLPAHGERQWTCAKVEPGFTGNDGVVDPLLLALNGTVERLDKAYELL